jgi:hypothetical protein
MQAPYLLFIFCLLSWQLSAQIQDSFTDGEIRQNPTWQGDTSFFIVNDALQLQSKGPAASGQLYLSTPNTLCRNTEWSFYLNLDFAVSTSNWVRIYLCSNNPQLSQALNGYYLKTEGTTKSVDLYRQTGSSHTKIIAGQNGVLSKNNKNELRIKVYCSAEGFWQLYSDTSATGTSYRLEGTAQDTTLTTYSYAGIYFSHTSTRKDGFYFDDFQILEAPLSLVGITALSRTLAEIAYNLPPPEAAHSANFYHLSESDNEIIDVRPSARSNRHFLLYFAQPFSLQKNYHLSALQVLEAASYPAGLAHSLAFYYQPQTKFGDIVFTEIMANPNPSRGLPEYEYVEIFNRSEDTLDLAGFGFSDENSRVLLPSYLLHPQSYATLCPAAQAPLFTPFGHVLGISNFPSLHNTGERIQLQNNQGTILHEVRYHNSWYGDNDKKNGGWSLEKIDADNVCTELHNWIASIAPSGGTPSQVNSVAAKRPDNSAPEVLSAFITNPHTIEIRFQKKPFWESPHNLSFRITPDIRIESVQYDEESVENIYIHTQDPFETNDLYSLQIQRLYDCLGNKMTQPLSLPLALPLPAKAGDLIVNEVLFNPHTGGHDFVEIFNRSNNFLNLQDWYLANLRSEEIFQPKKIASTPFILAPRAYAAFTKDKSMLHNFYPKSSAAAVYELAELPSYNNDQGTVLLLDADSQIHDRFDYSEKMHHIMIDHPKGISLERITDKGSSNDPANWHSAASSAGYATPGYQNSQHTDPGSGSEIRIEPSVFSPDGNGYQDYALIHYAFDQPGLLASISIFDLEGRTIQKLAQNALLGQEGFFRWDGDGFGREKVSSGAYIVWIEIFDTEGLYKVYKETVVVGWDSP